MNFDQLIIREFLKLNPGFTDTPVLLNKKRVGSVFTGTIVFQRTGESTVYGSKPISTSIPDLSTIFKNVTPSIEIYKPTNTRDIAKALFEKYGVVADISEIVSTAVQYDPLPLEVEIVAMSTGLTITGRVTVAVKRKTMPIEDLITVTDADAVEDTWPMSMTQPNITKRYYWWDFTRHREELDKLVAYNSTVSYDVAMRIYNIMKSPDIVAQFGDPGWKCDFSSSFYDLREVAIPYVGPPEDTNLGAPGYKKCVVVKSVRHGYYLVFNYDR